ncbi:MAG: EAL domain-containing protein [Campylobacterota bacterium]|nr:EAL domain-containing protein [Campylobacterota bacterium]
MNQYIGRQPILKHEGGIFAYDLFYRDDTASSDISNGRQATATVIMSVLNKFGTKELLGGYPAFVKVDRSFLMHDLIWSIPKEFFVLSLLDDIDIDERVIERVEQMHLKGFQFAVNDIALSQESLNKFKPILDYVSFCKISIMTSDPDFMEEGIAYLKDFPLQLIATKVETREQNDQFHTLGIDLFQGYYFAKPNILENKKYDPNQMSVIRLCNMMMSEVGIDEITSAFEENHALTLQLLQFINSAAFHFRKKIASIHHILTLMGRNPLTQWLLLMVYSKSVSKNGDENSPLLLMVKSRTELMTGLLKLVQPGAGTNLIGEAYFVAVLSLMDTLFSVKLEKILEDLNVAEGVKDALLHNRGVLGEIYVLVSSIEHFETSDIDLFVQKYHLNRSDVEKLLIGAIENVNMFEDSLKSEQQII